LLPKFDPALGSEVLSTLTALDVNVVLGERLDLSTVETVRPAKGGHEERVVRTLTGREIRAELVLLCTGQTPNTGLMKELLPDAIVPSGPDYGLVRVSRSMQVGVPVSSSSAPSTPAASTSNLSAPAPSTSLAQADSVFASSDCSEPADATPGAPDYSEHTGGRPQLHIPYPHLFCVGDSADAFGAIKAGHTAYWQAEVAARNILRMVRAEVLRERIDSLKRAGAAGEGKDCLIEELEAECRREEVLEKYAPGLPAIKVSLGLDKSAYQVNGEVGTKSDCAEDLDVKLMWAFCGITDVDEAGMYA
jgi:NADH dehydrogenase FAD-containing subunit